MKMHWITGACLLFAGSTAFADFTVRPDEWRSLNKDLKEVKQSETAFSAVTDGKDPQMVVRGFKAFAADENFLLSFDMSYPAGKATNLQLFFTTADSPKLDEAKSIRIRINGNGETASYSFDLAGHKEWKGSITSLRLDPVSGNVGDEFTLGKFSISGWPATFTVAPAAWRPARAVASPVVNSDTFTAEFPANQRDPFIQAGALRIPAEKYSRVSFELSLPTGSSPAGQIFWAGKEVKNFNEAASVRYKIPADGTFHTITIDLSKNPSWKGEINTLRFDIADTPAPNGGPFSIRNFQLQQ